MKYLLAFLLLATPLKAQIVVGNDSVGFTVDTISRPKLDPSHPWIWGVNPQPIVRELYNKIASCEGLNPKDGLNRIHFFLVNGYGFGPDPILDGYVYLGYTIPRDDGTFWIFLALGVATDPEVASHEMLHVLLILNGYKIGHPDPFFNRCGMHISG